MENEMCKQDLHSWTRTIRERIEDVWTGFLLGLRADMVKDERAKDQTKAVLNQMTVLLRPIIIHGWETAQEY